MGFFSKVAKIFGYVTVKTRGNQVVITGIDGFVMQHYIRKIFYTDVITKMMFTSFTDTSITFNQFFIPDILYILKRFSETPNCRWAAKSTVDKIIAGINENTWYKVTTQEHASKVDLKRLRYLKWKPLPKQIEFLSVYGEKLPKYDLRGYLLAAAPGTGKTFTDIMVATCIIPPEVAKVKIIISPKKALHLVWEKTIRAVYHKVPSYWCSDSPKPMPYDDTEYYIFNFEQIDQAIKLGNSLSSRNIQFFVIVDESHNFADYRSNRTQRLVKLQTLTENTFFIWASGSPILKSAAELTSFLKCADRRFDDDAERRFRRIFAASPGRASEIFNHRLGEMMAFLVPKSTVSNTKPTVLQLPVRLPASVAHPFLMASVRAEMKAFIAQRLQFYEKDMKRLRTTVNGWLDFHEKTLTTKIERNAFYQYLRDIRLISQNIDRVIPEVNARAKQYERSKLFPGIPPKHRKEFKKALSAVKNIKQKVRGEALGTVLAKRRSECAAMLGIYCKPEVIMKQSLSKTLFFASSVYPVKMLGKYLKDMGFSPLLVYAETNAQLTKMMEDFDTDPSLNPVCATMQSLSEAVPVTAASTVVLLNRPFRDAVASQVIARADRLGQIHPVTVIEVLLDTGTDPNVSSTTDAILSDVREMISQLVGPEFISYDEKDRLLSDIVDASQEDPQIAKLDAQLDI